LLKHSREDRFGHSVKLKTRFRISQKRFVR
jgi:hypothetical protein